MVLIGYKLVLFFLFHDECRSCDIFGFLECKNLIDHEKGDGKYQAQNRNDHKYDMRNEVRICYWGRHRAISLLGHQDEYYDENYWYGDSDNWVNLWIRWTPTGQTPYHTKCDRDYYDECTNSNACDFSARCLTIWHRQKEKRKG